MGYRVTPYFGVEAGYVSSDTAQLGAGGVSLEVSPRSFYGALVGTWPLSPAVSVSAKLGAAHTRTTVEIIYENMYEGWREKETSAMFGVGAAWAVSRRWAVVAEYQHLGKVVKDDATIKVSMVSVGARFSF
jgi:opacity protein-like surface antigen